MPQVHIEQPQRTLGPHQERLDRLARSLRALRQASVANQLATACQGVEFGTRFQIIPGYFGNDFVRRLPVPIERHTNRAGRMLAVDLQECGVHAGMAKEPIDRGATEVRSYATDNRGGLPNDPPQSMCVYREIQRRSADYFFTALEDVVQGLA